MEKQKRIEVLMVAMLALGASPAAADGPLLFQKCSAAQVGAITADLKTAKEEMKYGVKYMTDRAKGDPVAYTFWFGYWDDARVVVVTKNMLAILAALGGSIGFNCGPSDAECGGAIAVVDQGATQHVLKLCAPYFAPATDGILGGRPGVLVHEISHFSNVANTDNAEDIVHGDPHLFVSPENEALYAWMFPEKAVRFSEAYQYFAATVQDKAPLPPAPSDAGQSGEYSHWPHCAVRSGAWHAPATGPLSALLMLGFVLAMRRKRTDPRMRPDASPRWRDGQRRSWIAPIWLGALCVVIFAVWTMRSRGGESRPALPAGTDDDPTVAADPLLPPARGTTPAPEAVAAVREQPKPAIVPAVPLDTEYGERYLDVVKRMNLDADRERRLRAKIADVAYACRLAQSLDYGRPHEPYDDILPSGRPVFHPERRAKDLGKHYHETLRVTSEELDAFVNDLLTPEELAIWKRTFRDTDADMADSIFYQTKIRPLPPTPDLPNPFTPDEQRRLDLHHQAEHEKFKNDDNSWFTKALEEDAKRQREE